MCFANFAFCFPFPKILATSAQLMGEAKAPGNYIVRKFESLKIRVVIALYHLYDSEKKGYRLISW